MPSTATKGRSRRLINIRNEKLMLRYYFWREIKRRRTDDVFQILSAEEFYLDEITIRRIIRAHLHLFEQLKSARPSERKLSDYTFD